MKRTAYLVFACLFATAIGCSTEKKVSQQSDSSKTASQSVKDAPEAFIPPQTAYNTVTQCPVRKETFKIAKGTPAYRYKGKEYYMCCPACSADFEKNPDVYVK